jgi:hypothetical protein
MEPKTEELVLRVISQGTKGAAAPAYELPGLSQVRLDRLCQSGLLRDILRTGAKVRLEPVYPNLADVTDPRILDLGPHVYSAEPTMFGPADTVVIRVADYALRS